MTVPTPRQLPSPAAYAISVTIGWHTVQLRLHGDIDLVAAQELSTTLARLDRMPPATLDVDMSDVTFLDSSGVRPLVDTARHRRATSAPPLSIVSPSTAARRLLHAAGLGIGPQLNIDAWDRLDSPS